MFDVRCSAFSPPQARFVWFGFFSLALFSLTGCRPAQPQHPQPTPVPVSAPAIPLPPPIIVPPPPTPPPPPYVPNKRLEVGKIFNGMQYRVTLQTETGTTATADRNELSSYSAELTVKVKVPKPNRTLAEIRGLNENLPTVLPGLPALLDNAKVSPAFDDLYRLKCASLQASLMRLDGLLSRHNFYDCETILELQHPQTKRRALFVQADMDVDTDGSDSDRVPEIDGASATFQPFTSFRWAKKTDRVNSFIAPREAKIKTYETELAAGASGARRDELKSARARLRTEIADLKTYSFLVASTDPYIVLPGSMFGRHRAGPFAPAVGDFCVIMSGKNLYPAVVGDVGPTNLVGEASLRICKQINPRANAENRPENELKISYLVFPGTSEKWEAPDLEKWQAKCEKLLGEIGGHTGELFVWEDLTKPKPPPATPAPATPPPATPAPMTPPAATPAPISPPPASPAPKPPAEATPAPSTAMIDLAAPLRAEPRRHEDHGVSVQSAFHASSVFSVPPWLSTSPLRVAVAIFPKCRASPASNS